MKNTTLRLLIFLFLISCASAAEGKRKIEFDDSDILHQSVKQVTDIPGQAL